MEAVENETKLEWPDSTSRDRWFESRLRSMREIAQEMERNRVVCEEECAPHRVEIARVEAWRDAENTRLANEAERIQNALHVAAMDYDFGNKKSRNLPSGTFGFRHVPARVQLDVQDTGAAVAFAREKGIPTNVKETIGVGALREFYESTGTVPEGCTVVHVPGVEKFEVKVSA